MKLDLDRLYDLMVAAEMSFDELSEKTGISRTTLYRIRRNPSDIKLCYIDTLADLFGIDPFRLLKRR